MKDRLGLSKLVGYAKSMQKVILDAFFFFTVMDISEKIGEI